MKIHSFSIDTKNEICCVCGKLSKIHRRFNDEPYCATCYSQWFPSKVCSSCHKTKRIHHRENICSDCLKNTDCVRCGKKAGTFCVGKVTQYGSVCNSCFLYFRKEKQCFECGKISRNMSRSPLAPHNELLCLSCYRKYSFATCKNCGRYRKVHNQEKQLCKKCDEKLFSTCSKCKNEMPSGYGDICANCSKRILLFNLIRLNAHLFRNKAIKTAYKKFIFWYMRKYSISVVLHKSPDYVQFFIDCDDNWKKIPDYTELVKHFKPNGLRSNLTVLRWLLDTNQIVVDEKLKDDLAELQRIQALFSKLKESVSYIATYYQKLQERCDDGKTSLKSVRLALQPAIDLVSMRGITDFPTQEQLNNYLVEKSGQIAAITGFINHLKLEYHCELNIDRKLIQQMKAKQLRKRCSQRLAELYKKVDLTKNEQMELIYVVLYSLHGVEIKKPKKDEIILLDKIAYYHGKDKNYFLPQDIYQRVIPRIVFK